MGEAGEARRGAAHCGIARLELASHQLLLQLAIALLQFENLFGVLGHGALHLRHASLQPVRLVARLERARLRRRLAQTVLWKRRHGGNEDDGESEPHDEGDHDTNDRPTMRAEVAKSGRATVDTVGGSSGPCHAG